MFLAFHPKNGYDSPETLAPFLYKSLLPTVSFKVEESSFSHYQCRCVFVWFSLSLSTLCLVLVCFVFLFCFNHVHNLYSHNINKEKREDCSLCAAMSPLASFYRSRHHIIILEVFEIDLNVFSCMQFHTTVACVRLSVSVISVCCIRSCRLVKQFHVYNKPHTHTRVCNCVVHIMMPCVLEDVVSVSFLPEKGHFSRLIVF